MSKKIILTERQYISIINNMRKEIIENSENTLNEAFWDNIKYGISKLGRYKADGKILGKGKVDQEYAEKIKQIIEKEGNDMIRQLDAEIKEANPEFPNNKDPQQFLHTVMAIASVYDSLVAATQKKPKQEGYMPIDVANSIINDLREYTKKYLDVDLAAVYSGFDESVDDYDNMIAEQEFEEPEEEEEPLDAGDVRSQLQAKRGEEDSEDFASSRMDTLKSNKLPMLLAGIGASLGALGWLAQTEWFKHLLEELLGGSKVITKTKDILSDVGTSPNNGEGFVSWAGKIMGKQMNSGADLQQFISKHGAENVSHMFDGNGGGDSMEQLNKLQQIINKNPSASMGDIFKTAQNTFGSMNGGQNLFGVSKSASFFVRTVTKQLTKTVVKGAGTALAGKIAGLSGVLTGVGIALVTTGALVKLVRMKGQKSSRAATLNALYQSMRDVNGGTGLIKPTNDANANPRADNRNAKGGGNGYNGEEDEYDNDDLYNHLKNLFQFIVNNKKTMGTKTPYDTGRGQALREGKYIKDKKVLQYLDKNLSLDKVKNFEELLNRVEYIRNVVKKMNGRTGDKNLDGLINQLSSNPIMLTDFNKLTQVDPNNQQEVNSLLGFIKETLLAVYSGNYKFNGMVDKMGSLGGGNINKVTEEASYSMLQPNNTFMKDAQSKSKFKNNLVNFLNSTMNIFQYLHKRKGGQIARKDTTNNYTPSQAGTKSVVPRTPQQAAQGQAQPQAQPPAQGPTNPKTGQTSLFESENVKLMEEINRIKKIMIG